MTTLVTALNGATLMTTNTAPTLGNINSYNASSGALAVSLPALSGLNVGASCVVEKWSQDTTLNTVSFTTSGADTFDDLSTTQILLAPGEKRQLQVITISGTKYWKMIDVSIFKGTGLSTAASAFTLSNSTAATTIITATLPNAAVVLAAGSLCRIALYGTVQVASTSGILTFTPFLQGTALAQTAVMATQGSAAGPVGFMLEFLIGVRTTGTTGSAIATPWGQINFTSPAILTSTSSTATTVNTTAAASSQAISVQAQWATASASNILTVNNAVIERLL
jgi:hypothetical protein